MQGRKRPPRYFTYKKAHIEASHCFFWRWHHLAAGFVVFAGIGAALAAAYFSLPRSEIANASVSDNIRGWAWADPIGWVSLNSLNPNSGGGSYGVNLNLATGELNGFGWSENAGWICFGSSCSAAACSGAVPPSSPPYNMPYAALTPAPFLQGATIRNFHGWAKACALGDEGWISLNCNDPAPPACAAYAYRVPFDMSTQAFVDTSFPGSPANGSSFAWNGNTNGSGLGYFDFRLAYLSGISENTAALCSNAMDDDLDGAVDCADSECAAQCVPPQSLTEDQCPLGSADLCCSDGTDNESDGTSDCEDPDCQGTASMCTVAWLKTKFGNVYAQKGIDALAAPNAQYNATYCLSISDGLITGFASQSGCLLTSAPLSLPKAESGYKGSLGVIDVKGIQDGRYGPVVQIADGSAMPEKLDGKVYIYTGGGTLTLPAKQFQNGNGQSGRGNGLLFVKGADLAITGNMSYAAPSVDNYLRNLASFGVIVTRDAGGQGGNIRIDPNVSSLVGALFAETSISTGDSTLPLQAYGLFASRALVFERTSGTAATAAETVTFDGRAVANPPPGMQDIGKSLPTAKDAF
ncbi:hypothetical protein KKD42_00960 [Patescibacteria group bacterium]|nr:hypothetical protein [Patescibacteria group bacterium]